MKACTSSRRRRAGGLLVLQQRAHHPGGLLPFVGLQAEQDGRLVGEILVHRSDAHPARSATRAVVKRCRPFAQQNLNSGFEDGRDQLGGAGLLR
jgi:hypothetical protein